MLTVLAQAAEQSLNWPDAVVFLGILAFGCIFMWIVLSN